LSACSEMHMEGSSNDAAGSWGKLPDWSVLRPGYTGSFDCVAIRFGHGNYAQDDRDWL
jgi:hypothetical protein